MDSIFRVRIGKDVVELVNKFVVQFVGHVDWDLNPGGKRDGIARSRIYGDFQILLLNIDKGIVDVILKICDDHFCDLAIKPLDHALHESWERGRAV